MKFKYIIPVIIMIIVLAEMSGKKELLVFSEGVSLPVIMYHSVLEETDNTSDYIISTNQLENDIIYLKNQGFTPITCNQLIKYTNQEIELPEKPILLTFDDGMYNNMQLALPILEKHNYSAIFSIVGEYAREYSENQIKNVNYSYINWEDLNILGSNQHIELANHSYALHSIGKRYGPKKRKNEEFSEYLKLFTSDMQKMQLEFYQNCTFKPVIYTYPFGGFCSDSERILKKNGFLVTLSCVEGINKITKSPECLYLLKRFNRSGKLTTEDFFKKIGL